MKIRWLIVICGVSMLIGLGTRLSVRKYLNRKSQTERVYPIKSNLDSVTNWVLTNSAEAEWDRIKKSQREHMTNPANWIDIIQTNKFVFKESGTLLMTISNQPYVQLFGGFIIRASDEDWNRITNCYRDHIETNAIEVYCP